jgi:hypothetical protein
MTRAKKRKRQPDCKVAKLIDTIERAISTAITIYQAVEPIAKGILTNRRKTK